MMDWEARLRQQYALAIRPEWLEQVMAQLRGAHPDFSTWTEDRIFDNIFTAFLFCDLNQAGAASLPVNTKEMHKEILMGKFVLQLDEVVNMAAAARERYSDQAGNRCLKFALTDGCQQVVGVEYTHLPAFTWDCPAGSKVLIHNAPIRRGLLLLGPDNTALLGGQVERLEAARQRAVAAWTKPVVGRPAGSAERDIFAEARHAAWDPRVPAGAPQVGAPDPHPQAGAGAQAAVGVVPPSLPHAGEAGGPPLGAAPQTLGPRSLPQPHGGAAGAAPLLTQVAGPAGQPQHLAQPQQAQHVQHRRVLQQQQQQVAVPGSNVHQGYMPGGTAVAGGMAPSIATEAGGASRQLQGNLQGVAHHYCQQQQQQQQQQGWQQWQEQQQQQGQLQAPIPQLTCAMQSAGPPAEPTPPWLGRAASTDFGVGNNESSGSGQTRNRGAIAIAAAAAAGITLPRCGLAAPTVGTAGDIHGGGRVTSDGTDQDGGGAVGLDPCKGLAGGGGNGTGALPMEVVTLIDSDSASGDSPPHPSMNQAGLSGAPNPSLQPPLRQQQQTHPQQQQQRPPQQLHAQQHQQRLQEQDLPRRRLPASVMQAASLLGGSAAPSAAATHLGPSTSSPARLLPPRPTAATRASTPCAAAIPPTAAATTIGVAGTGTASRKAALPLTRSSPAPSASSLGSVSRSGGGHAASVTAAAATAVTSPTRSTATLGSLRNRGDAQTSGRAEVGTGGGAGAAVRIGRGAGLAVDVEMVDLADLDDDDHGDGNGDRGGSGALNGNDAAHSRDVGLPQAMARDPWHAAEGNRVCYSSPGSAERPDKRPRLSPAQQNTDGGQAGSIGADGGANGGVSAIVHAAADGTGCRNEWAGSAAGTMVAELVPETQMDFDDLHFGHRLAEPGAEVNHWLAPGADDVTATATATAVVSAYRTFPAGGVATGSDHLQQNPRRGGSDYCPEALMAFDLLDSDVSGDRGRSSAVPPRPMAAAAAAAGHVQPESWAQATGAGTNHAGAVWLCQVADMLRPEPDSPDVPVTFPMTLDVYGVVYELDGDRAVIEDGTGMMEAQLTDGALAPLLVGAQLPPGFTTGTTSIGLEDIWTMVDSLDPAMQACGQELADRIMAFFRDFSGLIRLEFHGPPPAQPLIIQVTSDGAASGVDRCSGLEGGKGDVGAHGDSCQLYRTYLRTAGALSTTDMDEEDVAV
ncbi:hypothetical protein Vretimale_4130 [Volvox reticuliferus]|uniref:RecQ-mediated genome instability protein 1 n=2 Tax=Volvox reticuliferus TaxID=1737510 RepID=A0A8J4FIM3_9CHLO|nr:hypothetical protein Vretifemale_2714 [Volvox reticuliferus]GIL98826.1 hypothetical protein Vretimale_4130 [Volvox reticuliferus]